MTIRSFAFTRPDDTDALTDFVVACTLNGYNFEVR